MKFNLKSLYKAESAKIQLEALIKKGAMIELKELKVKRSLDANALYWLWLSCIEKETGISKDELHLLYRCLFLRRDEDYITEIIIPELWQKIKGKLDGFLYFKGLNQIIDVIAFSTTEQETDTFSTYLKKIRDHARIEFNVILLNLDEKHFEEFYREYGFYN